MNKSKGGYAARELAGLLPTVTRRWLAEEATL
jgi:hypothetical protein